MALLEALFPRRARRFDRMVRWPGNFMIVFVNTLAVRLIFPTAAVGFALLMQKQQIGLLNLIDISQSAAIVLAMLSLDLTIYIQHVLFHRIPVLWRLHRMHHTDMDLDVTSGARFHPIEILLSMLIKLAAIAFIGAPAAAVLLFEVVLNAGAMFNHANLRIPVKLDALARLIVVTPDMHRVHHSIIQRETNSNFGFNLPWWDYICGTYRAQPREGHQAMTIGLKQYREDQRQSLHWLIMLPFIGKMGAYAINRRYRGPAE